MPTPTSSTVFLRVLFREGLTLRRSLLALLLPLAAFAAPPNTEDFTSLTLEELSQVQITSIARKQGALFDTTAAAYVLTGEDIHRLGATDLASALRPVPGMQVGQIDPFNYAISARGFNDATSSKLLVLMDGRSLYSQTFSGAYWNYHELFLEDLDRIEIIRGPGATLWGANAMNGVINIVSKSAFSTLGSLVTAARGDHLDALIGVRQGWQIDKSSALRVYARFHDDDNFGANAASGSDGWNSRLFGARYDWKRADSAGLTLISEWRDVRVAGLTLIPTLLPPYVQPVDQTHRRYGGHMLGRWHQPIAEKGELSFQASYEHMQADDVTYGEKHDILDSDLQLTLHPWKDHELLAGASFRDDRDHLRSTPTLKYSPADANTSFTGAFVQDDYTVARDRFVVTLGAKFERNSFTGWETQPGLRALWHPTKDQSVWAAVSRAARTPSRSERTINWLAAVSPPGPSTLPGVGSPLPISFTAIGSPTFDSEHLTAFELGYRLKATAQFSVDAALFVNRYRDVRGLISAIAPVVLTPAPHTDYSLTVTNNLRGQTYGGEFIARWRPRAELNFEASVASVRYDLSEERVYPLPDVSIPGLAGSTPHEEYKLRAAWEPHDDWTFDAFVRHVDAMPMQFIPAYTGLDAHVSWRPRHELEIEFVAQNALDASHPESPPNFLGGAIQSISRSYFLRLTYRY